MVVPGKNVRAAPAAPADLVTPGIRQDGTNVLILFLLASVENGRLIRVACLNFDSVLTDMKVSELGFGN